MKKVLLVLLALTVLSSYGFAWYNDTITNDSGLTIESTQETYGISRDNPIVKGQLKITNPGLPFIGTISTFFEEQHAQKITIKEFELNKIKLGKADKSLTYLGNFEPKQQKKINIPTGETLLDFEFTIDIQTPEDKQGEFVFIIENDLNPLQKSILDPQWETGAYSSLDPYAIALYHCDEVGGTTVTDAMGAYNATATNAAIWDASGKWNGACGMDKTYWFSQGTLMDVNTAKWTIEFWWKPLENYAAGLINPDWYFFDKLTVGTSGISMSTRRGEGDIAINYKGIDSVAKQLKTTTVSWTSGTWYHFSVEYDGTNLSLYVDGNKQDTTTAANLNAGTASDFFVGNSSGGGYPNNGVFDEIMISNIDRNSFETDANTVFTAIDGYNIENALPSFSYLNDKNLSIDFNVFVVSNDRIVADINYSTTNVQGTGTPIFTDLNITSDICPDLDWNDLPSECSIDWNIMNVTDNNYYILFNPKNLIYSGSATTPKSFAINNDVNLTILLPIDEESLTTIDTTKYSFSVSIKYGNTLQVFEGMTDQNSFRVPKGTNDYIIVEIDTNTSDYFSRRYSYKFLATDNSETLQPYLVKTAVAGENGFQSVLFTRTKTNIAIPNVRIISRKVVPALGLVKIEEALTDVAGSVTFSFVSNNTYFLDFYRGTTLVWQSVEIRPVYTQYQFYIDQTVYTIPDANATTLNVTFFPEGSIIDANVLVDLNVDANVSGCVIQDLNVYVYFDNNVLYDNNFEEGHYDLPMISILDSPAWRPLSVEVFLRCTTGETISVKHGYTVNPSQSQTQLMTILTQTLPDEWNPFNEHKKFTTLLALVITIFIVGAVSSKARIDFAGSAIFTMLIMGLFTMLGWVMFELFIAGCVITAALIIVSRGGL